MFTFTCEAFTMRRTPSSVQFDVPMARVSFTSRRVIRRLDGTSAAPAPAECST